ncbi:uncharacterized protein LOC110863497 isoform X1 [Folsomia candida]|uniref:uncharacterized protein LOC110863497 isoform X1 n=2 Tax=Folsomia candida TaxID=158441 RepID=UPI000B8EF001|nr:uncharacterized protein LOC110863497 isoform X1 [Folsomia candida]
MAWNKFFRFLILSGMTFSSLIVESQTGRLNLAKTALLDNPDTKADISLQPKLDHSRTERGTSRSFEQMRESQRKSRQIYPFIIYGGCSPYPYSSNNEEYFGNIYSERTRPLKRRTLQSYKRQIVNECKDAHYTQEQCLDYCYQRHYPKGACSHIRNHGIVI